MNEYEKDQAINKFEWFKNMMEDLLLCHDYQNVKEFVKLNPDNIHFINQEKYPDLYEECLLLIL